MPVAGLTSLVGDHGVYAVFALMAIDAVFPAASELVMVYGGALAAGTFAGQHVDFFGARLSTGAAAYLGIALAGTLGYVLGSIGGWALGLYGGRPLLERRGRWFHLSRERLERAEAWFDHWEDLAVLVGRVTPVVRSFVSIPAGVFRVPFARYTVLTAIGSAAWCFALAGVGWIVGSNWERFHHDFRYADYAIAFVLVATAAWVWRRRRSTKLPGGRDDHPAG